MKKKLRIKKNWREKKIDTFYFWGLKIKFGVNIWELNNGVKKKSEKKFRGKKLWRPTLKPKFNLNIEAKIQHQT